MTRWPEESPRTGCLAVFGCVCAAVVCGLIVGAAWTVGPWVAEALR
jgi:hypothetical protein